MKYTFDDKLKAVKYYLETGSFLYPEEIVTRRQKRTFAEHVRFWKAKYLLEGEDGLRHKNKNVYSPERKLMIIEPVIRMEISMKKQAKIIGIDEGTLCSWIKRFKLLGMDGLKCFKRGRSPKDMPDKKKTEIPKESETINGGSDDHVRELLDKIAQLEARNRDLEHKNLMSQAEIEYLKKLHALAETKRRLKTPTKPKSSVSSAKATDTKVD